MSENNTCTCKCVECSTKSKARLDELIKAVNTVNGLNITTGRKLDLIYVLCNEINALNNMIVQMQNNNMLFDQKIAEMDAGALPASLKACIEQSLNDLKTNKNADYATFHKTVSELWNGKFEVPADTSIKEAVDPEIVKTEG